MSKLEKFVLSFIFFAVILFINSYLFTSDYMDEKEFEVTAINVAQTKNNFYVVYKLNKDYVFEHEDYILNKGYVFDQIVSAATYTQTVKNKNYVLTLRPFDIKQTGKLNALYYFGAILCLVVTILCFANLMSVIFRGKFLL